MKTIIITGASRGIGLATAKKFLIEGWRVIGTYLDKPAPIENPNLVQIQYNQSDSQSIAKTAAQIATTTSHLDALINNAGVLLDADDEIADPVKLRKTLEVNVIGVVDLTEHLLPLFQEGSQIVNMDSGHGRLTLAIDDEFGAGYRISKTALNMYTHHLAFRLQSRGVIVSSMAPGWVQTDMGNSIATETSKPDRTPEQAADDIFQLVTTVKESGFLWEFGKKIDW